MRERARKKANRPRLAFIYWWKRRQSHIPLEPESTPSPADETIEPGTEFSQPARGACARLIKKVYEMGPLICPHCGGEMRFLAVVEEAPVIERILRHLGRGTRPRHFEHRRWRKTGRTIARSRLPTIVKTAPRRMNACSRRRFFATRWGDELAEMARTDKQGYANRATAGLLALTVASSAALAESKFLSLLMAAPSVWQKIGER